MDALRHYRRVWLVDYEFTAMPGERPTPLCVVARELHTGWLVRRWLTEALAAAGRRLESDPGLQDTLRQAAESAARAMAEQFHDELAGLVTGTIQRWDAAETSSQLELLLGHDLHYIRINGTVVGAGIGLALHAIVLALS